MHFITKIKNLYFILAVAVIYLFLANASDPENNDPQRPARRIKTIVDVNKLVGHKYRRKADAKPKEEPSVKSFPPKKKSNEEQELEQRQREQEQKHREQKHQQPERKYQQERKPLQPKHEREQPRPQREYVQPQKITINPPMTSFQPRPPAPWNPAFVYKVDENPPFVQHFPKDPPMRRFDPNLEGHLRRKDEKKRVNYAEKVEVLDKKHSRHPKHHHEREKMKTKIEENVNAEKNNKKYNKKFMEVRSERSPRRSPNIDKAIRSSPHRSPLHPAIENKLNKKNEDLPKNMPKDDVEAKTEILQYHSDGDYGPQRVKAYGKRPVDTDDKPEIKNNRVGRGRVHLSDEEDEEAKERRRRKGKQVVADDPPEAARNRERRNSIEEKHVKNERLNLGGNNSPMTANKLATLDVETPPFLQRTYYSDSSDYEEVDIPIRPIKTKPKPRKHSNPNSAPNNVSDRDDSDSAIPYVYNLYDTDKEGNKIMRNNRDKSSTTSVEASPDSSISPRREFVHLSPPMAIRPLNTRPNKRYSTPPKSQKGLHSPSASHVDDAKEWERKVELPPPELYRPVTSPLYKKAEKIARKNAAAGGGQPAAIPTTKHLFDAAAASTSKHQPKERLRQRRDGTQSVKTKTAENAPLKISSTVQTHQPKGPKPLEGQKQPVPTPPSYPVIPQYIPHAPKSSKSAISKSVIRPLAKKPPKIGNPILQKIFALCHRKLKTNTYGRPPRSPVGRRPFTGTLEEKCYDLDSKTSIYSPPLGLHSRLKWFSFNDFSFLYDPLTDVVYFTTEEQYHSLRLNIPLPEYENYSCQLPNGERNIFNGTLREVRGDVNAEYFHHVYGAPLGYHPRLRQTKVDNYYHLYDPVTNVMYHCNKKQYEEFAILQQEFLKQRNEDTFLSGWNSGVLSPKNLKVNPVDEYVFERKRQTLYKNIYKTLDRSQGLLDITVDSRLTLVTDSFEQLFKQDAKYLRSKFIKVAILDEMGEGPGIVKEWFTYIFNILQIPQFGVFLPSEGDVSKITFDSNAGLKIPQDLDYTEFAGKVLAMAIYHRLLVDVSFERSIYQLMLDPDHIFTLSDVAFIDPVLHKTLTWIRTADLDQGEDMELYFEDEYDTANGKVVQKYLNQTVRVTNANKELYIRLKIEWLYKTRIRKQLKRFLIGFDSVVPLYALNDAGFNPEELDLLIGGIRDINVDVWMAHTTYVFYTKHSRTIKIFWKVVRSLSAEKKGRLLLFVTSCSRLPVVADNIKFIIRRDDRKIATSDGHFALPYPQASTCENTLYLPEYSHEQELMDALLECLQIVDFGFK